jgi:predicted metal-dependent phosphoesterase TrpH
MNTSFVDLHCHSTASDGTDAPADVVRKAQQAELSALSLTDHDTVAGLDEAAAEARRLQIDFLPGIEISCQFPSSGTMHLLGYGIDPTDQTLGATMRQLIEARSDRNIQMIKKLNEQDIHITLEQVQANAGGDVIGRPHIANVLVEKGYVSTRKQAFDRYLGTGRSAYVDKERLTDQQAIDVVHAAGGLVVLAHPVQLRAESFQALRRLISNLKTLGLDGIETIHTDHDDAMVSQLTELADELHLLKTGGSDYHGENKFDVRLGWARRRRIPREMFDRLLSALAQRR